MPAAPLYRVPIGACLVLDGVRWNVIGKDNGTYSVEGLESGELTKLPVDWLQKKISDFSCKVITPAQEQKRKELLLYTGGFDRIDQLSKQERVNVRGRLSLVLAIEKLEGEGFKLTHRFLSSDSVSKKIIADAKEFAGDRHIFNKARVGSPQNPWDIPQGRTLKLWIDRYRHFDRNEVVLAGRHHKKGPKFDPKKKKKSRLEPLQIRFVRYVLDQWLEKKKPKIAPIYKLAKTEFKVSAEELAAGFEFPSITTIRNWKNALPKLVKVIGREGERHAANLAGSGTTEIPALFFGEEAETDQVYLSIFISDDGIIQARALTEEEAKEDAAPNEIRRVWLHYMLDLATRMPLAWVLSESADSDSTMALLRMATRDKTKEKTRYGCKGTPAPAVNLRKVVSDNGTAVRNGPVVAALLGMGTVYATSRAYHSNDKPFVESGFRTLEFQVIGIESGYSGGRPGALPGYDPVEAASLSLDELYGKLTRYFIDEYPHQEHRGTAMFGASPAQKMREVLKNHKEIDAPDQLRRLLHLGMKKVVTTTPQGVKPFGLPFNSTALQRFCAGTGRKVTVHIDPDHLQQALVTAEGHAGEPIFVDLSMTSMRDLTLEEILQVMQDAVEADPELKAVDDQVLWDARKRRAEQSGMFPDSQDPANYGRLADLERKAERLMQVETRPKAPMIGSVPPGSIMDRSHPAARKKHNPGPGAEPEASDPPESKSFKKVTESKF